MEREKLSESINKTTISESTKSALKQICEKKDRKEQEIIRYCLNALAKRFRDGRIKDEELY